MWNEAVQQALLLALIPLVLAFLGYVVKRVAAPAKAAWGSLRAKFKTPGEHAAAIVKIMQEGFTEVRTRQDETALHIRLGNARIEAQLDSGREGLFYADVEGNWTSASPTLMRWTERSLDELRDFGWLVIIPESHREEMAKLYRFAVAHKHEVRAQVPIENASGTAFESNFVAKPYREPNSGQIAGFAGRVARRSMSGTQPVVIGTPQEEH